MPMDKKQYDSKLIKSLIDKSKWPKIDNLALINKLFDLSAKSFEAKTLSGYLSSVLIDAQICEELIKNLIKLSWFYIRGEIWPARINYEMREKLTFGQLIGELERTLDFRSKDEFIAKCKEMNESRIRFVHKLTEFKTNNEFKNEADKFQKTLYQLLRAFAVCKEDLESLLDELAKRIDWDQMLD